MFVHVHQYAPFFPILLFAQTLRAISYVRPESSSSRFARDLSRSANLLVRANSFAPGYSAASEAECNGYSSAWSAIHLPRGALQRRARGQHSARSFIPPLCRRTFPLVFTRPPPHVSAEQFNLIPFYFFLSLSPSLVSLFLSLSVYRRSYQCLYLPATPRWNHFCFRPDTRCFQIYYCRSRARSRKIVYMSSGSKVESTAHTGDKTNLAFAGLFIPSQIKGVVDPSRKATREKKNIFS